MRRRRSAWAPVGMGELCRRGQEMARKGNSGGGKGHRANVGKGRNGEWEQCMGQGKKGQ